MNTLLNKLGKQRVIETALITFTVIAMVIMFNVFANF